MFSTGKKMSIKENKVLYPTLEKRVGMCTKKVTKTIDRYNQCAYAVNH